MLAIRRCYIAAQVSNIHPYLPENTIFYVKVFQERLIVFANNNLQITNNLP